MADWPSIENPTGIQQRFIKRQYKSEGSLAGYVTSRPLWTRGRKAWKLSWGAMPEADVSILEDFFNENQGKSFAWMHPRTGVTYTVRFSDDEIVADYVPVGQWKLEVNIEQI